MSLATFKKKSIISQHRTKISASSPGGYWLNQGPFGPVSSTNSIMFNSSKDTWGPKGFSLNGGRRNVGYVGQSMAMSKNGTPFKGALPRNLNGSPLQGDLVMNSGHCEILGNQYKYIKPSVLSTYGMLRKKYRWAYSGTYPNNIVQSNYGNSNLAGNTSQGVYLNKLGAANDCVVETNNMDAYVGYVKTCPKINGGCTAKASLYTKNLHQAQTSSQHTLRVQRKCADPDDSQKPYPPPNNTGKRACVSV